MFNHLKKNLVDKSKLEKMIEIMEDERLETKLE